MLNLKKYESPIASLQLKTLYYPIVIKGFKIANYMIVEF